MNRTTNVVCAGYLEEVFDTDTFKERCEQTAALIKKITRYRPRETKPTAIAVTGFSGVSVGSVVSYLTGLPLIYVRKLDEDTASSRDVEGPVGANYLILDDLIATGRTVNRIAEAIEDNEKQLDRKHSIAKFSKCVGIILWHNIDSDWFYEEQRFLLPSEIIYRIYKGQYRKWSLQDFNIKLMK